MVWNLINTGKDGIKFNIALSAQVAVNMPTNSESMTLTHKRSSMTINGIDSVADTDNGKVLEVMVNGKSSRQITFNMSGK